ncbi:glycosyltransferase [Pseudoalteromonas shioyasakiensis]|uniref:glycosyltransferase n=1 Tax=Pseudoalteromonas shioyasakiensis TaxID=1190813 RepID=UPI0021179E69|nr:glycosyltransferase [Pseudoalteromonas shioyasakiensis]MCQ8876507.1 glycosyltransferase [Pseudoalteromonas shioyasakiensis]
MSKKVVCLVINSLGGGGAERVFARLVNLLDTQGQYKVTVITLDQEAIENPLDSGIKHIQLDCQGSLIKSMINLKKALYELNPDLVISFLTRSNVAAVYAGRKKPFPVVISERVNTSSHFGNGLLGFYKKAFTRYFYNKADSLIAVSNGVKHDLSEFFNLKHKKIYVIGNSYSHEMLLNKADEFLVEFEKNSFVVCVGRFYKNKNHSLLINALASSSYNNKLVLLGDGPERKNLEELVKQLNLTEQVIFKGFIKNPYPYIKNASGLISTSLAEGFPNVIAEALVLGKFVVSSDCPSGPSELLDDRVSSGTENLTFAKFGVLLPLNNEQATSEGFNLFNEQSYIDKYELKVKSLKNRYSHEQFLSHFNRVIEEVISD